VTSSFKGVLVGCRGGLEAPAVSAALTRELGTAGTGFEVEPLFSVSAEQAMAVAGERQ